ncbi:MAG: sulfotransferase [Novosphingobium aromaticivorans]|nr:sulfotransferase [Novosphingobium aromaticivorans]
MSPAPAPAPVPSGASPEGHILALARAGRRDEALAFARGAVDGARVTRVDALLATLLVNAGEREEARGVIEAARARPSDDPRACDALAHAALRLGAHRLSRDFYARAARLAPGDAGAWYNLAASERALGALEAAGEACDAAIACDGDHAASHLLRSELRVQSADGNHVDVLRAALARAPQDGSGRVALGYALAKELDDLGESAAAWAAWTAAAAARRAQMAYDVATDEAKLARIAQVFTQGPEPSAVPEGPALFVFIVGLPRSGTTLLERMLSNLPGVVSHGETDHFAQSLLGAAPRRADLDVFARAALADPAAVGRAYAARAARADGISVIEKLPMNYLYLGAMARALPHGALLALRRSPLESCFAMFRTLFGDAYPFSYALDDLARYYAAWDRLMGHWRALLGPALLEIRYDELVTDPQGQGARAAQHCRLPWEEGATAIEANRAASLTASAAQVRRPIYRTSLDKAARYGALLDPLRQALVRHGIADPDRI